MAGKRTVRSKKHPRSSKKRTFRKRVRISHRPSSTGIRPAAVTRYSALRSLMVYPKKVVSKQDAPVADSWLDKLYKYGLMALKLFMFALSEPREQDVATGKPVADWVFAITAVCQGFYLGVDDFIINSPISESIDRFGKKYLARFDYKQGRIISFTISVTPSAELSKRAGEYVVAVVMLSVEQTVLMVSPDYPVNEHHQIFLPDEISFEDAIQYPNAVVSPADKPTQLSVVTSGNAAEWHRIGHHVEGNDDAKFPGGPPILKLVFGYRDMSSAKPDASNLYSADESLINIDISAKMCFREPGKTFIRTQPLRSMNDNIVDAVLSDGRKYEIPCSKIKKVGALVSVPHNVMMEAMSCDDFDIIH